MVTASNTVPGFQQILQAAERDGIILDNSRRSLQWLQKNYANLSPRDVTERKFISDLDRRRRVPLPGRMYMFLYNPKTKDTLPYWDRFPMVFPFRIVKGGFYGINLHYIAPKFRALLMDSLYSTINNTEFDETTRLKITYKILNGASKYRWFKPCVKHYLRPYMGSDLLYISPHEWNLAMFVPSEQFKQSTKKQVWEDSKKAFQ